MGKIKMGGNPENKTLMEIVKEAMKEKEPKEKKLTFNDLKKRKVILDKYDLWYMDWLLLKIIDSYFKDVSDYARLYLDRLEFYERKGYYIDALLDKYNYILDMRRTKTRYCYY